MLLDSIRLLGFWDSIWMRRKGEKEKVVAFGTIVGLLLEPRDICGIQMKVTSEVSPPFEKEKWHPGAD